MPQSKQTNGDECDSMEMRQLDNTKPTDSTPTVTTVNGNVARVSMNNTLLEQFCTGSDNGNVGGDGGDNGANNSTKKSIPVHSVSCHSMSNVDNSIK